MVEKICVVCKKKFEVPYSHKDRYVCCSNKCRAINQRGDKNVAKRPEVRKKISKSLLNNKRAKGFCPTKHQRELARQNIIYANLNINNSPEKIKKRLETVNKKGLFKKEKNPNWKGGITTEVMLLRKSKEYDFWRHKVFERDNWTCQVSLDGGNRLIAHHIEGFANNKKSRLNLSNGVTLKKDIHDLFHSIYGPNGATRNNYNEFKLNYTLQINKNGK